jgi:gas vesicle protein
MSDPDLIRDDIERTRRELGQDVDALADKVNPAKAAQRQTDKVKRAFSRMSERVMGTADDMAGSTQNAVGHAGEAVADAPRKVARATEGNPVAAGLIAFGVGMLVSSLIPASRQEQRLAEQAKDAAAPILEEAKQVASESAEHLREPAREAAESVKERATEAAETVKAEGADAASTVQADAKHAADRQMGG